MSRSPPSPSKLPVLGDTLSFARDPFEFVRRALADHGDIVGIDVLGREHLYVFAHPDYAKRVLLTDRESFRKTEDFTRAFGESLISSEGESWRKQRTFFQPFFYPDRVEQYVDAMAAQTERRIDRWTPGDPVNVGDEMTGLTLDILFATVLGRELAVGGDEALREAATGLNEWFAPSSWALPTWVPTPARRRFHESNARLREEVNRIIDEQQQTEAQGDDLLSTLLDARDEVDWLTDDRLVDQMVNVIFAGHETTAHALTFTWHQIATHPEVRRRVHAEIDDVLGGDQPTADDLADLTYVDRVITEALRLYPPVHTIPRRPTTDIEVGGYEIPEGSEVHVSPYHIHRDERFYDDPLDFRPDRWTEDFEDDLPDFAYIPFGGGPRVCIGRQFALAEAKVVLATIGQQYTFDAGTDASIDLEPKMTTQPAADVVFTVQER